MKTLLCGLVLLAVTPAVADEGLWTFDRFPSDEVKARHGFAPDATWLEHVRRSSARTDDCSAGFVSPNGLVVTNAHCSVECAEQLSTAQADRVVKGFYAAEAKDEVRCPGQHVDQLLEITDVTERVAKATQGKTGEELATGLRAELGRIEKACQTDDKTRCQVVTLYRGGLYHLYRYRRWNDVRLVFIPEQAIAFFGGDPDNYEYPRWNYDVSFLRVYEDGKPAATPDFFRWAKVGPKEGDVIFMSGNPGKTSRLLTVAQLRYQRQVVIPEWGLRLAELRGLLLGFGARGPEQKRISATKLYAAENNLKRARGQARALGDPAFMTRRDTDEKALRERIAADPAKQARYGGAWDKIDQATQAFLAFRSELRFLEDSRELGDPTEEVPWAFESRLFVAARELVRARAELALPSEKRLREYQDASLPGLTEKLLSPAPIYDELEIALLSWSLSKMREELRPDHPVVRKLLARETPEELATRVVKGTKLGDPAERKRLWEDKGALGAAMSTDAMLQLAAAVDEEARAARKKYEAQVEAPLAAGAELIARARFEAFGTSLYPDATFTPRLSYGVVRGYELPGKKVPWATEVSGLWERATARDPFALPPSWLAAKSKLPPRLPFNFVGTPDSVGGNSGSPILDRAGQLVGLNFDQNIEGTATPIGYEETRRRAVFVHADLILEALKTVYGATRIVDEIRKARP